MADPAIPAADMALIGHALEAAVADKRLEGAPGKRLAMFFDTDVIAGAIYALDQVEKDWERHQTERWAIVRALWARGALCPVRLTVPHLRELRIVLTGLASEAGAGASQQQRVSEFARRIGLADEIQKARRRMQGSPAPGDPVVRQVDWMVEHLTPIAFAVLDAEAAMAAMRQPGQIQSLLDLQGEPGDDVPELLSDPGIAGVLASLAKERGEDEPSLATQADAAAVIALGRLGRRAAGTKGNEYYRFYTQSIRLRRVILNSPYARGLLTLGAADGVDIDTPRFALRSSNYLILRAAITQLAFAGAESHATIDTSMTLDELEQVAHVLRAQPKQGGTKTVSEISDTVANHLGKRVPSAEAFQQLLDTSFCYRVWLKGPGRAKDLAQAAKTFWQVTVLESVEPSIEATLRHRVEELDRSLAVAAARRRVVATIKKLRTDLLAQRQWRASLVGPSGTERWLWNKSSHPWSAHRVADRTIRRLVGPGSRWQEAAFRCSEIIQGPTGNVRFEPCVVALLTLGCEQLVLDALARENSRPGSGAARWLYVWAQAQAGISSPFGFSPGLIRGVTEELAGAHHRIKSRGAAGFSRTDESSVSQMLWAAFYLVRGVRRQRATFLFPEDAEGLCRAALDLAFIADHSAYRGALFSELAAVKMLLVAESVLLGQNTGEMEERVRFVSALVEDQSADRFLVRAALLWSRAVVLEHKRASGGPQPGDAEVREWVSKKLPRPFFVEEYQLEDVRDLCGWYPTRP